MFIRAIFGATLVKGLGFFLSYLVYLAMSRLYGAQEIGRYFLAFSILICLARFAAFGFEQTLIKVVAGSKHKHKANYVVSIALMLVVAIAVLGGGGAILLSDFLAVYFFNDAGLVVYLQIMLLGVPAYAVLIVISGLHKGVGRPVAGLFFEAVLLNLIMAGLMIVFVLWPAEQEPLFSVFIAACLVAVSVSGLSWFVARGIVFKRELFDFNRLLVISLPVMSAGVMHTFNTWADVLILGVLLDSKDVGVYGVAAKISRVVTIVLISVNAVIASRIAVAWAEGDEKSLQAVVSTATKIITYLTLPVVVCIVLGAEFILGIFGEEFKEGVVVLRILGLAQIFNVIGGSVSQLMCLTCLQKEYGRIILTGGLVNIILNVVLVMAFGLVGAAIASGITVIYVTFHQVLVVKKKIKISADFFSIHERG